MLQVAIILSTDTSININNASILSHMGFAAKTKTKHPTDFYTLKHQMCTLA